MSTITGGHVFNDGQFSVRRVKVVRSVAGLVNPYILANPSEGTEFQLGRDEMYFAIYAAYIAGGWIPKGTSLLPLEQYPAETKPLESIIASWRGPYFGDMPTCPIRQLSVEDSNNWATALEQIVECIPPYTLLAVDRFGGRQLAAIVDKGMIAAWRELIPFLKGSKPLLLFKAGTTEFLQGANI